MLIPNALWLGICLNQKSEEKLILRSQESNYYFYMDKSALICYNLAYWLAGIFMNDYTLDVYADSD